MTPLEYKIGGTGSVLIEVGETHDNRTGIMGLNGKELVTDISYDPQRFAKNFGTVIQLPSNMGGQPVTQDPVGFPAYGCIRGNIENSNPALYSIGGKYSYRHVWHIVPEVRLGDKIWFKPRVLNNPANKVDEVKGKKIFRVAYDQIICAVRERDITDFDGAILLGTKDQMPYEQFVQQWKWKFKDVPVPQTKDLTLVKTNDRVIAKEINMIGSWCLLLPVLEDWKDILMPTYYSYTDDKGDKIPKPKEEWIQTKLAPGKEKMRGIVRFFGKPFIGEECDIEQGMKVWIRLVASNWMLEIEGHRYIVCRQNQLLAEEID